MCFQTGHLINGRAHWFDAQTGSCPLGPPGGATWFTVQLRARHGHGVTVYLDGHLVTNVDTFYPNVGRGGALAFNGYRNVIRFNVTRLQSALSGNVSAVYTL